MLYLRYSSEPLERNVVRQCFINLRVFDSNHSFRYTVLYSRINDLLLHLIHHHFLANITMRGDKNLVDHWSTLIYHLTAQWFHHNWRYDIVFRVPSSFPNRCFPRDTEMIEPGGSPPSPFPIHNSELRRECNLLALGPNSVFNGWCIASKYFIFICHNLTNKPNA